MAKNERERKTGIGYGTPGRALQLDDALRNFLRRRKSLSVHTGTFALESYVDP